VALTLKKSAVLLGGMSMWTLLMASTLMASARNRHIGGFHLAYSTDVVIVGN